MQWLQIGPLGKRTKNETEGIAGTRVPGYPDTRVLAAITSGVQQFFGKQATVRNTSELAVKFWVQT
eukprot:2629090-Rhodomonas_salina.1